MVLTLKSVSTKGLLGGVRSNGTSGKFEGGWDHRKMMGKIGCKGLRFILFKFVSVLGNFI